MVEAPGGTFVDKDPYLSKLRVLPRYLGTSKIRIYLESSVIVIFIKQSKLSKSISRLMSAW